MRADLVSVQEGETMVTGVLKRVDRDGALVLDSGGVEHRVVVGDVIRGPKSAIPARE
jgi:hypothetical protein